MKVKKNEILVNGKISVTLQLLLYIKRYKNYNSSFTVYGKKGLHKTVLQWYIQRQQVLVVR